jgi:hypothetical protein
LTMHEILYIQAGNVSNYTAPTVEILKKAILRTPIKRTLS